MCLVVNVWSYLIVGVVAPLMGLAAWECSARARFTARQQLGQQGAAAVAPAQSGWAASCRASHLHSWPGFYAASAVLWMLACALVL